MVYLTDCSLNSRDLHCLVLTSLREITLWSLLGLKGSNDVATLASRNFDEGVSSLSRKMALILLVWLVYNYCFNAHSWQILWNNQLKSCCYQNKSSIFFPDSASKNEGLIENLICSCTCVHHFCEILKRNSIYV